MIDLDPHEAVKLARSPFAAGFIGAIVSIRSAPGSGWKERTFNIFCGSAGAGFLAPAASEYFGLTSQSMQSAMAFAIGLFGLNLMAVVIESLKTINLGDYIPWKKGPK